MNKILFVCFAALLAAATTARDLKECKQEFLACKKNPGSSAKECRTEFKSCKSQVLKPTPGPSMEKCRVQASECHAAAGDDIQKQMRCRKAFFACLRG